MLKLIANFLHKITDDLSRLNYRCELNKSRDDFAFEAKGAKYTLKIRYMENANNLPYSLYDMEVLLKLGGRTYLYNLSERSEDDVKEDLADIDEIIDKVIKEDDFTIKKERFWFFWTRSYLVLSSSGGQISLLQTNNE